jgi:hypothetical protein
MVRSGGDRWLRWPVPDRRPSLMEEPILAQTPTLDLGVSTPALLEIRGLLVRLCTHRLLGTLGYATVGGVAFVVGAVGVLIAPATGGHDDHRRAPTHRLALLAAVSRRTERIAGPLRGLLVDG